MPLSRRGSHVGCHPCTCHCEIKSDEGRRNEPKRARLLWHHLNRAPASVRDAARHRESQRTAGTCLLRAANPAWGVHNQTVVVLMSALAENAWVAAAASNVVRA